MRTTIDIYCDAPPWQEAKHPRDNAGRFAGGVLHHGTNELSSSLKDPLMYLTNHLGAAKQYARNAHYGGWVNKPEVHHFMAAPGKSWDISSIIAKSKNGEDVISAARKLSSQARKRGYRYIEYDHPGPRENGETHHVVVSLFPRKDLKRQGAILRLKPVKWVLPMPTA